MSELLPSVKKLVQQYKNWYENTQNKERVTTIHVDEVASKVAGFYEKIRGVVDWREEHLMKRGAIERILKRRLFLLKNGAPVAEPLIMELIRGGHFPNDKIPEAKIELAQRIIDKYVYILKNSPLAPKEKMKTQLYDWILNVAACEIEELLSPPIRERALIEYMYESMLQTVLIGKGVEVSEEEKNIQIYIAVQRALLKLDYSLLSYNLLKKKYDNWRELVIGPNLEAITENIYTIWKKIDKDLRHPFSEKFYNICERFDTPYLIIGDIISEDPNGIKEKMENPEFLENKTNEIYQKRLDSLKTRIRRMAIYATLSIFITKILMALVIEIPFDKYIIGHFNYLALSLSVIIPPLLMLFLISTIRPPQKANAQQVLMEVIKLAYGKKEKETFAIKIPRKRGWLMNLVISTVYLLTFVFTFGVIITGLKSIGFGALSIAIFLLFICLISFAGTKIRERSKELEVTERRDSMLVVIIDLFSMPVIQVGKWLSSQWVKYNIVVILLNTLIEMPFQIFVEFVEQWRAFLKEKREKIH